MVIPFKLFSDHSRFRRSQEGLKIANPVTRISLTWTVRAEELGTMSKKNVRGITLG